MNFNNKNKTPKNNNINNKYNTKKFTDDAKEQNHSLRKKKSKN